MIYIRSTQIRKRDISDIYSFRENLKKYSIKETPNFFTISFETEEDPKEKVENIINTFKDLVNKEIIVKVVGLNSNGEIVSELYVVDENSTLQVDTIDFWLEDRGTTPPLFNINNGGGIRIIK